MKKQHFTIGNQSIAGLSTRMICLCLILPMIAIVGLICLLFTRDYTRNAANTMDVSASLVTDLLDTRFTSLNTVTMAPYYCSYFVSSSRPLSASEEGYIARLNNLQDELRTLFDLTTFSDKDIQDLVVISDGSVLYHQLYNYLQYGELVTRFDQNDWYTRAFEADGRLAFTPAPVLKQEGSTELYTTPSYYLSRQIRDLRHPERKSLILLNINTTILTRQLADMSLIGDTFVVLSNGSGEIVYTSRPFPTDLTEGILSGKRLSFSGSSWRTCSQAMPDYDLTVHVIYSMDELYNQILLYMVLAFAVYLIVLVIAHQLYTRLTGRIRGAVEPILSTVDRMDADDLATRCPPLDISEFDRIGSSINRMAQRLDETIRREYLLTIQQKNLQMYALRSQIQPHFLNNTIYCFIALNQIGEKEILNDALYRLTHLLRYVLSGEQNVTLKRETEFLQSYLELQKLRFETRLSYDLTVDPSLETLIIPRLILQPLVENAVIHGMEPSTTPCHLSLEMTRDDERIHLRITDNGAGFDEQAWQAKEAEAARAREAYFSAPQPPVSSRKRPSIGLFYIRERLRLWSADATFRLSRQEDLTVAEITVPIKEVTYESADR